MSVPKQKYISASQIDKFLECPLAYKYIYVDGCERMPGNIYMSYGTSIHYAIAENYKQKISSRVDLPTEKVIKIFTDNFQKEVGALDPSQWGMATMLSLQGEEMMHQYMKQYACNIMPALVEHKFEIELGSFPVTILGYIDLVTEEDEVIDHKTAGTTTMGKWTQRYVDDSNQLTIYGLAFRKMYKRREKCLRIDAMQRNKSGPVFKTIETQRTDMEVMALIQLMARMKEITEKDLWFPNLNSCSGCDFKNSCPRLCYFPSK